MAGLATDIRMLNPETLFVGGKMVITALLSTFIAGFAYWVLSVARLAVLGPKVPFVGSSKVLPRFVANLAFFRDSKAVIDEGYQKYRNRAFWFARNDADMIVLPKRCIEEIRSLSKDIASPASAHVHNLLGPYTYMDIILKSDLHFRVIQTKLTPNLVSISQEIKDELDEVLPQCMPECKEWTQINPYHTVLDLVARASARAFVGLPWCRNKEWLEISTQFTENVFLLLLVMRTFPTFMHPFICHLIPPRWRISRYIKRAQKLLVPEIKRRQEQLEQAKGSSLAANEPGNLLSWMIEAAEGPEQDPNHLAHLEVIISLASIHTSQMNAVHVLFDLAAHPEYVKPLRDEIERICEQGKSWSKSDYSKLRKMDSFLRESQRFNPPSRLSYHRIMQQSMTLKDGTFLPKNAHICMAVNNIQNDAEVTEDPERFDPFRFEAMRQREGEGHLHQFATAEPDKLNFGYGKYACPGRFFASLEIKSILVKLIMKYDFKLVDESQGRPRNLSAYEFIFPNPKAILLVRERQAAGF